MESWGSCHLNNQFQLCQPMSVEKVNVMVSCPPDFLNFETWESSMNFISWSQAFSKILKWTCPSYPVIFWGSYPERVARDFHVLVAVQKPGILKITGLARGWRFWSTTSFKSPSEASCYVSLGRVTAPTRCVRQDRWFPTFFIFTPILTHIFQLGWNHQLDPTGSYCHFSNLEQREVDRTPCYTASNPLDIFWDVAISSDAKKKSCSAFRPW